MKVIYENQVKASGVAVDEFKGSGMLIIFGDNAPEEVFISGILYNFKDLKPEVSYKPCFTSFLG